MLKILIGVVAVAVITIVVFMVIDPKNSNTGQTSGVVSLVSDDNTFKVTVEGEVLNPGTYTLNEGALMSDLIESAGGLTNYVDDLAYFEEAELDNGSTYFIASKYDAADVCSLNEVTKVNINSDDANTLQSISAITNSVATYIVAYRNENGQFNTVEDLLKVYGIGPATYRKIRGYVTLHQ